MRITPPLPRTLAALGVLAVLAACADTPTAGPADPAGPSFAAGDTLPVPPDSLVYEGEKEYEEIARQVPGYAAHWYDPQGNRVIRLTDLSKQSLAVQVIDGRGQPELAEGETRTGVTNFIQSTYDFATLRSFRNRVTYAVLRVDSVALVDLDEQRNRLFIGLAAERARAAVEAELVKAGVPLSAAIIEVTGAPEQYQTLQNFFRPLRSGFQIQNPAGVNCTLGVPSVGMGPAYITASHCTQVFWWNTGTGFFQNVVAGANFIGAETVDPAGWACGALTCRRSDAALIPVAAGVPAANQVARTAWFGWHWAGGSINTAGIAPFNVVNPPLMWPAVGQIVDKVGRTTGWNRGVVTNTCVNVPGPPGRLLMCQSLITNLSGPGDSGSPVFRQLPANTARITGLLWGAFPGMNRSIISARGGVFLDLGA